MIEEGTKAPHFSLKAILPESDEESDFGHGDLAGAWSVLYFYPRDNTPGCTTEAEGFRDAAPALEAQNARVVGVSKDSLKSHLKFRDKKSLNFPLISDPEGELIEAYGAWGEKNMYGKKRMGIIRSTFILDPEGMVARAFPKVRVKGHVDAVLEALGELTSA